MVVKQENVWLDLKEPSSGSLGRPAAEIIRDFLSLTHLNPTRISIAGGELNEWTDDLSASMASILPAHCCLKFGLSHCSGDWIKRLAGIRSNLVRREQLILVHYADSATAKCPDWTQLVHAAERLDGRYVLVDTFDKTCGGLLDHYTHEQLVGMIQFANSKNLEVALAGSLQVEQLRSLMQVGASWLGFRGAVCETEQRTSRLCNSKLQALQREFANCIVKDHLSRNES